MSVSPYCGVTIVPGRRLCFQAQVCARNRVITWPRRYLTAEEAARVADVMAVYLQGSDVVLNFDGQPPAGLDRQEIRGYLMYRRILPPCYHYTEPPLFAAEQMV